MLDPSTGAPHHRGPASNRGGHSHKEVRIEDGGGQIAGQVEGLDGRSERERKRFEIAVGNFGRSCIGMKANEKSFQAWYASSLIQEFGLSRVYRELHLSTEQLFRRAGDHPFYASLRDGSELFPDIGVSWEPDIDARHSRTRDGKIGARTLLLQFGIITEFKVTGSTKNRTAFGDIKRDLEKLALFTMARKSAAAGGSPPCACYMVILDNHGLGDSTRRRSPYDSEAFAAKLDGMGWPSEIPAPTVMVIQRGARQPKAMRSSRPTGTVWTQAPVPGASRRGPDARLWARAARDCTSFETVCRSSPSGAGRAPAPPDPAGRRAAAQRRWPIERTATRTALDASGR